MWKFAGVCLITGFIAGCGGGGGGPNSSSSSSNASSTSSQALTLSGSVVKGPVANATIQAVCHDMDPAESIGMSTSDAQGKYTLKTNKGCTSVIELLASAGTYVDEATGDRVTGTSLPWLRSVLDASGNDVERTVQITALTDLLRAKATIGSGISKPSKATVSAARQGLIDDLKLLTGTDIDPVVTEPSMLKGSNSDSGVAYTLLLSAVSKLSGPSVNGLDAALTSVRNKGFGKDSPLADPLRFVASSSDVLTRIGVSQAVAGKMVIQTESYVAVEALRPLTVVPDSSSLSCEPLEVQAELSKLVKAHANGTSGSLFSDLSLVLSQDSYIKALQTWKGRCPVLADALNIFIAAESLGADFNYKEFVTRSKPLLKCANVHGTVVNVIVRGTGYTVCVNWDGKSAPDTFLLSSVDPAPSDSAMAWKRCVELSTQPLPFPWSEPDAVFILRGTPHMYCGTKGGGGYSWLDRQNVGYYAGTSSGTTAGTTSVGSSGVGTTQSITYDQLSKRMTREFTGKDLQVRQCTDRVDALYPNGVGSDTEPYWPPPYSANIKTGIGCSINFGLAEYSVAYVNLNGCAASYIASDYEAVGRRGYAAYMVPARDNLSKYYNLRRSKDPLTYDLVCKGP
jgi:hypothetical protein